MRLGDRDLTSRLDDRGVQTRDVIDNNVSFHPKYVFGIAYYDVAVIKLDPPVTLTMTVRPICLPESSSSDQDEFMGDLVRLSGCYI